MIRMIEKILIAEDHESASISVQKTLENMGIKSPDYVFYCDDAILRIQKALEQGNAYDLLITDLYFEKDHREQVLSDGQSLIEAVRKIQPAIKILVFSAENKPAMIDTLFRDFQIDGYVRKARGDAKELQKALTAINNGEPYTDGFAKAAMPYKKAHEFTSFDTTILSLMAEGKRQQEISEYLNAQNIKPSGLSTIEKRLSYIKEALNFSTNEQLIAHCVKMGII